MTFLIFHSELQKYLLLKTVDKCQKPWYNSLKERDAFMFNFWIGLLITIAISIVTFPCAYFYSKYEDKRDNVTINKKTNYQIATVMSILPMIAYLFTWLGIWFNL